MLFIVQDVQVQTINNLNLYVLHQYHNIYHCNIAIFHKNNDNDDINDKLLHKS